MCATGLQPCVPQARARKHYMLYGGLYALHLMSWLQMGFDPSQVPSL